MSKPSSSFTYLYGVLVGMIIMGSQWFSSWAIRVPLRPPLPYQRSRQIKPVEPRVLLFRTGPSLWQEPAKAAKLA